MSDDPFNAFRLMILATTKPLSSVAGKPIYLDISIKVSKGWRADDKSVRQFGY